MPTEPSIATQQHQQALDRHPYWAKCTDPARQADWQHILDPMQLVPIMSPTSTMARLPGFQESQAVYMVDLSLLTLPQHSRLAMHISNTWKIPVVLVEQDLEEKGMPILARDYVVVITKPQLVA